jgi:hypothetical protein
MKNKIILFILLLLFSITLVFFIVNNQMETISNQFPSEMLNEKTFFIERNREISENLRNRRIENFICEESDTKQHSLSDLVLGNSLLVFRYSEFNCSSCYETELALLQDFFSESNRNVAILCSYQVKNYFTKFIGMNQIVLPIYRIPQDAMDWMLEDYNVPYYFVLHSDLKATDIFIPNKSFPELSKQYLERIKKLLSK